MSLKNFVILVILISIVGYIGQSNFDSIKAFKDDITNKSKQTVQTASDMQEKASKPRDSKKKPVYQDELERRYKENDRKEKRK